MIAALTSISVPVTLVVLGAGLLHAVWNTLVKGIADAPVGFALLNAGAAVPALVALPFLGVPNTVALRFVGASVLCHLAYELLLMAAYAHGTLSHAYPIARGVAPVLTSLGGLVFAGERLGALSLLGVALVVAGVVSLAVFATARPTRRGVLFALLTGGAIALYTVVDGLGVRTSHAPWRYAATLFAIQGTIFVAGAAWRGRRWPTSPRVWVTGLGAGALSLVAYGAVLYAQTRAPLGAVSALRETGVLWAALFGVVALKERGGWRLGAAAVLVAGGVAALALG